MTAAAVVFYLLAALAVTSAAMVIGSRSPIHSAIFLVLSFLSIAGLYVLLEAEFVAVVQVLVYAGGIMVLFLFVIMLVNLRDAAALRIRVHGTLSAAVGILAAGLILYTYSRGRIPAATSPSSLRAGGNLQRVGEALLTQALLPFEIASILLLVAMVGAIVLARRPSD